MEIREPYLTLELFVSGLRHRVPDLELPLLSLYRDLFQLQPNRTHLAIAEGIAKLKSVVILTSNFDDGLTKGLRAANVSYSLITDSNVGSANAIHLTRQLAQPLVEVCAYHGTVDDFKTDSVDPTPPTSMAARDLAHPFAPEMSTYINRVLSEVVAIENGLVVFVGHRGEDFYDLNLEIRNALGGAKSLVEREARQQRFVCVPHLGDLSSVSHFYEEALTKSGFVVLTDGGTEWLAGLFDAVSGKASPVTPQATIGASEVERRFVSQVDAVHPVNSPRRKDIATQCKSLLIDIEAGVLAAWSIVEHYRLESLGYPQDVIASFARPKGSRKFFDIPILDFLALQKEYQNFRDRFRALEKVRSAENALVDGLSLSLRLERLGAQARNVLAKPIPSMHKSLAAVLAAIAYDYAGLVAMRCMRHASPFSSGQRCVN